MSDAGAGTFAPGTPTIAIDGQSPSAVRRARLHDLDALGALDGPEPALDLLELNSRMALRGPSLADRCGMALRWAYRAGTRAFLVGMVAEGVCVLTALLGALAGLPPIVILFLVALIGFVANCFAAVVTLGPVVRQAWLRMTHAS